MADSETTFLTPGPWTIRIEKSSSWPTPWAWVVKRERDHAIRTGYATTKDRARRKALAGKRSIEEDDVTVTYE